VGGRTDGKGYVCGIINITLMQSFEIITTRLESSLQRYYLIRGREERGSERTDRKSYVLCVE
jgi:hypothetical protein